MKQTVIVFILIGAALVGTAHAQQIDDSEFLSLSPQARDLFILQEIRNSDAAILQEVRSSDAAILQELRSEAKLNEEFRRATRSDISSLRDMFFGLLAAIALGCGAVIWTIIHWAAKLCDGLGITLTSSRTTTSGTVSGVAEPTAGIDYSRNPRR